MEANRYLVVCRGMQRVAKSTGCALSGFVLVKKVPGTLHFLPKSPGHSFDYHSINMSHTVGYMYYGNKPSPRRRKVNRSVLRIFTSWTASYCMPCEQKQCMVMSKILSDCAVVPLYCTSAMR